jgi:molecular chaperone HtpG
MTSEPTSEPTPEPPAEITSVHITRVDLAGLMTVLAKHLYSTPEVAVRELVQNAHDSLVRRRLEDPSWEGKGSIRLSGDLRRRTLTVTDDGAGLTDEEIHSYLATVGRGYTRSIREKTGSEDLIGLFGLGFLSAFVLAEQVSLRTTSFQTPDKGWLYHSTNGQRYSVRAAEPRSCPGTEIVIVLRPEFKYIAASDGRARVLTRYCALLSEPIFIGDSATPINDLVPPWRRRANSDEPAEHPVETRRRQMEFAERFEDQFSPLCAMPVEPLGLSDARGLL